MEVFIAYDRYEHNEWFCLYHVDTDRDSAIKHCKTKDLVDFISYGPDDCHSFQLQAVEMSEKEYEKLCKLVEKSKMQPEQKGYNEDEVDKANEELEKILEAIFENEGYDTEDLISTDGCSDLYEIARQYARSSEFSCVHCDDDGDGEDEEDEDEDEDYDFDEDDEDEDEEDNNGLYNVVCCLCNEEFFVDEATFFQEASINCPNCNGELKIEFVESDEGDGTECTDEIMEDAIDTLMNDNALFKKILRDYIDTTY